MDTSHLHYFRTIARIQHMTKAAEELQIAQPALSKIIARLEEDLGIPLFDRQGRNIRLNTFGKTFLRKVEIALNALEDGRKEIEELSGLYSGSVHLAVTSVELLSRPLADFLSQYPKTDFRITQVSMMELEPLLLSGEVDICLTALPTQNAGVCSSHVLEEEVYLAVSPNHRFSDRQSISLAEAATEAFIGYNEGQFYQPLNDIFFGEAGVHPKYICRVNEPSAIASLVRAGVGVALVGECGRSSDSPLTLLKIHDHSMKRHYKFIWLESRYLSVAARKFLEFVTEFFCRTN
ncbi:LysR family transcriptional regulator [Brevibacillus brevis]|uniref:LysR family transcriptional regulator n=1 Tax=Brevibacillus brevis TaxID=1393 RepID=UPI000D105BB9|nr:LysR family transcriptional regulator [Brevibacillus brevis]PSJ66496.1 LysR family transcriptional regulator [Brevibacillus brevis]RED24082.1 DNA-binding transcriptional LysR family regulator [Brevibacillus brevis]VEF90263.1 HTH-type transcriptional regulator gltC [Brevibacillus brevis]